MKQSAPRVDQGGMCTYFATQSDVVVAYLFGSVAQGRANAQSDVDVAVLLEGDLSEHAFVERQLDLMLALDNYADREVQVTLLNRASPLLAYQVTRYGVLLYERDRLERLAFEVRAMKVYFDVKPMLDFFTRVAIERIKERGHEPTARTKRARRTLAAVERIRQRPGSPPGSGL
ncbi:MAG: type VII toxin-antitoxin system MntA family adenylyltransferase antitoxin [Anaerolineae bacterium]